MNVLFIGSIYSESFRNVLLKAGLPTSSAGQTFQTALLNGLDQLCNVRVISEFFIPTYPKFKKCFIPSGKFNHKDDEINDTSISFVNLPLLKKASQFFSYYREVRRNLNWADVIIVYEATSRQLLAPVLAAKKKPKIAIVPDLPEYMSDNSNPVYVFAKKIDRWLIDFAMKRFNGFVLLSHFMKDRLRIKNLDCLVLEGIFNLNDKRNPIEKDSKKIVLYTGKIEKWFGLEDLLKAFCKVKGPDYRLYLCGPGDIEMVNSYIDRDNRIVYKGCLTHEEVLELQKKATLLVNPRHSTDDYTLYSFPSKTMEYMASGTPTLMCKLKSLPDEYLRHLYIFEDETVEGYTKKIQECLDLPLQERNSFGRAAAEFIIKNKSS
ncbi:MAG: glycosyltransferase, partial [Muribaculaceae bacterium]|nr:glycosyltransferase [Muribaculaceae bacterium]